MFYPSDAVSCERAVELAANTRGICFIRASRPALPVCYANDESFEVGKAKILRQSEKDQVLVVAAGVTLAEALKAADELATKVSISPLLLEGLSKRRGFRGASRGGGQRP